MEPKTRPAGYLHHPAKGTPAPCRECGDDGWVLHDYDEPGVDGALAAPRTVNYCVDCAMTLGLSVDLGRFDREEAEQNGEVE